MNYGRKKRFKEGAGADQRSAVSAPKDEFREKLLKFTKKAEELDIELDGDIESTHGCKSKINKLILNYPSIFLL